MTSATKGSAGLAERYAVALFELAEQDTALDAVAGELRQLEGLIQTSPELLRLIRSPVISRGDQSKAIDAVLAKAGASALVRRFVGVVAAQRRLFALPQMIAVFLRRIADRKGETTAEIVSARPLSKTQTASLQAALKRELGTEVALLSRVEPDILGGLVVKVGSRMVDSSLRTKLNRLSLAIKGVG